MERQRETTQSMELFTPISPPKVCPLRENSVRWYTWSQDARNALGLLRESLARIPSPSIVQFGQGEYEHSLTLNPPKAIGREMRRMLSRLTECLHAIRCRSRLWLFDGLIDAEIDGRTLRAFLAICRSELVKLARDPASAIYQPLGYPSGSEFTPTDQGDFPLHADLYPPAFLFNIFDNVPADGSGASVFCERLTLQLSLERGDQLERFAACQLKELLREPITWDRYDKFFDFLHGSHPWSSRVKRALRRHSCQMVFRRGQGFLLHDRRWLHGRRSPSARIQPDRLHRFVFDSQSTLRRRTELANKRLERVAPF